MITFKEIEKEYIRIATFWGEDAKKFPLPLIRDDCGGYHLEISSDSTMSLIATERGNINDKKTTQSMDELLYWVFKMRATAKALQYEVKHRVPNQDFRRLYFLQSINEIKKLSDVWADRLKEEFNNILEKNPFMDELLDEKLK